MKFFIDTANLDQIREAYDLGVLDGVTTNPSLMAKEGIKGKDAVLKHYVDICEIAKGGDVSAEPRRLHLSIPISPCTSPRATISTLPRPVPMRTKSFVGR